jgi:signal transduction histidine kinase
MVGDQDCKEMLAAFDRVVATGKSELVLVTGDAGIGKSSVVNELVRSRRVRPARIGRTCQWRRDCSEKTNEHCGELRSDAPDHSVLDDVQPVTVLVAVRDSGPGLDPERFDRLFDAFYTTKPHGLGMGLAISSSIIEAHGGRLWAQANTPRGAVFQFTLPILG